MVTRRTDHAWLVYRSLLGVLLLGLSLRLVIDLPWLLPPLLLLALLLLLRRWGDALRLGALVTLPVLAVAVAQIALTAALSAVSGRGASLPLTHDLLVVLPAVMLSYATPGGEPWQWIGRAAALLGILAFARLLPAMAWLSPRSKLQQDDDPALGTARWATWRDLRGLAQAGWPRKGETGIVAGKLGGKVVRLTPAPPRLLNSHVLCIGASGAGKSTGYVLPAIYSAAMAGESLVLTDPKGELLQSTAAWLTAQGYAIRIFAPGQLIGHAWNPLTEAVSEAEIDLLCAALMENAIAGGQDKSTFFAAAERYLLKMLIYAVRAHPDLIDEQRTLPVLTKILGSFSQAQLEAFVAASTSPEAMETLGVYKAHAGQHSPALGLAAKLSPLKAAAANLGHHEIDMTQIKTQKTALFCVLPVGNLTFAPVLAAFYCFLFRRLTAAGGSQRVRFVLDEFANLGKIPGFSEQLAVGRGLGVDVSIILQALPQLEELYTRPVAATIQSNCAVHLLLGTGDPETSRVFSAALGSTAVRQHRDRHVREAPLLARRERDTITIKRDLLTPDEVRRLTGQVLIVTAPVCILADKLDFLRDPLYKIMSATVYTPPVRREIDTPPVTPPSGPTPVKPWSKRA
ncbi:MAG: Conjugal transfer protein TraG [Firmicutes bacterium]|nr:Conjugal transfer protein TraG [candidate division NPL-UPA2 bacterium]